MKQNQIWAEMARRKVQFHAKEEWQDISLWGLFQWSTVSHLLACGKLVTDMEKRNVTVWVRPSQEAWEKHIEPLIKKHSLKELTSLAGW